jgi:hypothetical protein
MANLAVFRLYTCVQNMWEEIMNIKCYKKKEISLLLFYVKNEISCIVAVKKILLMVLEEIRPDDGLE